MIEFVAGLLVGAIGFFLILRNNPKLAKRVAGLVDKIDNEIKN